MKDDELGCSAISLVEYPAVQVGFLKFTDQHLNTLKFSEDKHIITGVAMLADTPIYRFNETFGEHYVVFSKQCIRNIIEKYSKLGFNNIVNIEHSETNFVSDLVMVESYIIDHQRNIVPIEFQDIPDGSWIVSYKVNNESLWNDIKNGVVTGFSIEGFFEYGDSINEEETIQDAINELFE